MKRKVIIITTWGREKSEALKQEILRFGRDSKTLPRVQEHYLQIAGGIGLFLSPAEQQRIINLFQGKDMKFKVIFYEITMEQTDSILLCPEIRRLLFGCEEVIGNWRNTNVFEPILERKNK
jgi:hypothetical protein